ncbi:MAG: RecX family transcriptional regulator [Candidatus Neomarinimicrobiota bacterium]
MNPDNGFSPEDNTIYRITAITHQEKRKDRLSVFLDGKFAFGIAADTSATFPLATGQSVSGKQVRIILFHEAFEVAKDQAIRFLTIRMRSQREVELYLRRKQTEAAVTRRVVQYCLEHQYLDDRAFAGAFIRDQLHLNKSGILKIKSALRQKGVSGEIIDELLKSMEPEIDELAIAVKIGEKKLKTLKDENTRRQKLMRFLIQKGYRSETVIKAVSRLLPTR